MADEKPKKKKWIKGAVEHPGALKAKAEAAGETTAQFAAAHASDPGTAGKEARLAQTLMGLRKRTKPRRTILYGKKD